MNPATPAKITNHHNHRGRPQQYRNCFVSFCDFDFFTDDDRYTVERLLVLSCCWVVYLLCNLYTGQIIGWSIFCSFWTTPTPHHPGPSTRNKVTIHNKFNKVFLLCALKEEYTTQTRFNVFLLNWFLQHICQIPDIYFTWVHKFWHIAQTLSAV